MFLVSRSSKLTLVKFKRRSNKRIVTLICSNDQVGLCRGAYSIPVNGRRLMLRSTIYDQTTGISCFSIQRVFCDYHHAENLPAMTPLKTPMHKPLNRNTLPHWPTGGHAGACLARQLRCSRSPKIRIKTLFTY